MRSRAGLKFNGVNGISGGGLVDRAVIEHRFRLYKKKSLKKIARLQSSKSFKASIPTNFKKYTIKKLGGGGGFIGHI